jgi:hypothetical protein
MKRIAFFCLILIGLAACDKTTNHYMCYEPVYTDAETFRAPAQFEGPKTITKDGNIYFKDNYLFIVEPNKGIHFIDNSDPTNPVNTGFLNVMGASGLAIKGDYLYITALVDLVIVDVSNFTHPTEIKREEEIFPTALPLMEKNYPTTTIDKSLGVVTDWTVTETTEEVNDFPVWTGCLGCETFATSNAGGGFVSESGGSSATGVSGSYALMTIKDDYLYVIDNNRLKPISISNPTELQVSDDVYLSWNVETIFPHGDHLYMGTTTGMMIYNTIDPSQPQWQGSISHARACDPVVVQGNYAYVTVRSAGWCGGDINQLDVVNIADKSNPYLVESFEMNDPHGVGIDGNTLFVCDGDKGLKVFNAEDPSKAGDQLIKRFGNIDAVDIIPINGIAMVIAEDGLFQYDYSDPENLSLISSIKF